MSKDEKKTDVEIKEQTICFDYNAARPAIIAAGVAEVEVDHIIEMANEVSCILIHAMDAYVAKRLFEGGCCHPESLSLAVALVAEKALPSRLKGAGETCLDPIACVQAVRQFVEVLEDFDPDDVNTPTPTTIH